MLTLSIRQPWAWLIVRPDITDSAKRAAAMVDGRIKVLENRTWPTRYRGPILIHASKGMTCAEYEDAADFAMEVGVRAPPFGDLERGGIVGRARIVDCVTTSESPWFVGRFGFVLDDIEPLPFIECRGALGLFPAPPAVLERLRGRAD